MLVPSSTKLMNWLNLPNTRAETWLHDGICDHVVQVIPLLRPTHKTGGGIIVYFKPHLILQRVMLPPTNPSSFHVHFTVYELLFNPEPSLVALIYRCPNTSPPDNTPYTGTLETIISHRYLV